ncbi:general substrate transporter [Parathielavia hyrcaniae]|uniref:General substrate transporter n=1 Tax=Parathielavia hyrcaniae TaxID=113614 RepID=A0AAN6PV83_9PEZI|nr:general substrate transporter [Parathielavia hyrcaniae]
MSSHGSDNIASEKHIAAHDVSSTAVPAVPNPHASGKEKAVYNAELFAAIKEAKIEPWSKESIHLYFCIFVAFCCACANGYDGSLMTAIIGMPLFQTALDVEDTGNKAAVIFSMYSVGAMVGMPFAAYVADKLGRRKSMFSGGVIIITGMIIISSSHSFGQFVVGRFVLGLGISVMTVAAPAYAVEVAPPHWRGRCTGFYNCGWFGGAIPAAIVCFGSNYITNDWCWRVPLIGQAVACLIVMVGVFFIPESPRWLIANGREDEAHAFLVKYHGNRNPESRLVQLQIEEMREGIKLDGIDKVWWDYRPFLMSHSGRWRLAQVLMISIFGQFSGNGLGYFNTVIFKNIGVESVEAQLGYNILNQGLSAIGALTAMSLTDKMHRRKVLVIGTFMCAAALATNAGLSAVLDNNRQAGLPFDTAYGQGALASYFMFNIIFSFTYTPLQGAIPTEALETTTRAKGLALSGFIVNGMGFINLFAGPHALRNIGYKYIFVFVAWDVVESIIWFLFGVESQGRTLEQLEWVYNQPNPVKASLKVDKVVIADDGKVAEKVVA